MESRSPKKFSDRFQHNFSALDMNKTQPKHPFLLPQGTEKPHSKGILLLGLHPRVADKSTLLTRTTTKKCSEPLLAYTFTLRNPILATSLLK